MLRVGILVPGGGTNLQAVLDATGHGDIINVEISVVTSNDPRAYTLERAGKHKIQAVCIFPKRFPARDASNQVFLTRIDEYDLNLTVLAGFLVTIPAAMTREYKGRIINAHPSLIPLFCDVGYYGLKVHEAALTRGVKITGVTAHYMDRGTDTDLIILQKAVEVEEGDIPEILQRRVMEQAEWVVPPGVISMVASGR